MSGSSVTVTNLSNTTQYGNLGYTIDWVPNTTYSATNAITIAPNGNTSITVNPTGTTNLYLWGTNTGTPIGTAQSGVSLEFGTNGKIGQLDIIPGSILPLGGAGDYYLTNVSGNYNIYNTVPTTINNNSGNSLFYFVNYNIPSREKVSLTDFVRSTAVNSIGNGNNINFPAYNTSSDYCAVYFFANTAGIYDNAIAAFSLNLRTSTITTVPGSLTMTVSGTAVTLSVGSSGLAWWAWALIITGIIILVVIIFIFIAHMVKKNGKNKHYDQQKNDTENDKSLTV